MPLHTLGLVFAILSIMAGPTGRVILYGLCQALFATMKDMSRSPPKACAAAFVSQTRSHIMRYTLRIVISAYVKSDGSLGHKPPSVKTFQINELNEIESRVMAATGMVAQIASLIEVELNEKIT